MRARLPRGNLITGTLKIDPSVFHLSWRESHYPVGALLLVPSQLTLCFLSQLMRARLPRGNHITGNLTVDTSVFHLSWRESHNPVGALLLVPSQLTLCFPSQLTRVPLPCGSLIIGTLTVDPLFSISVDESPTTLWDTVDPLFSISVDESPTTLWELYYWYRLKENYNHPIPSITSAQSMYNIFPNNSIIGIVRDPVER